MWLIQPSDLAWLRCCLGGTVEGHAYNLLSPVTEESDMAIPWDHQTTMWGWLVPRVLALVERLGLEHAGAASEVWLGRGGPHLIARMWSLSFGCSGCKHWLSTAWCPPWSLSRCGYALTMWPSPVLVS
jgi:hypothetical protein